MGDFRSWWNAFSKKALIGLAVGAVLISIIVISALASSGDENTKVASSPPSPAAKKHPRPAGLPAAKRSPTQPDSPKLPTLTATQQASAVAIAQSDMRVGPLLQNPGATRTVIPWMTIRTHQLLGAGIDVKWPTPITVSGQWPVLFYDQTEAEVPPYLTTTAQVGVSNLTAVHLAIDLQTQRVLGVEALPDASVDKYVLPSDFHNTLPSQPDND